MGPLRLALATYSWGVIAALIAFLWRIACFYEKASGERLGHRRLIVPALLLAAGAIWYLIRGGDFIGHPASDVLLFGGGLLLMLFSLRLRELMTGERK